ncbi:hypothetical protein [Zoogloea sp.]|uniref:hypothetical protein n=1 Tax=Zoogloea sp. TaxID=49181 RepID=UPI001415CA0B|nr:MAG: hypothetical protein F9K15_11285 [Zoogloea sp.]
MTRFFDLLARKLCHSLFGPGTAAFLLDDPWQTTLFVPDITMDGPGAADLSDVLPCCGEFLRG